MKKAFVVSAYDYYDVMAKHIRNILIDEGYDVSYYIQSYNHYSKKQLTECRKEATMIKTISYEHNVSIRRLLSCLMFSRGVYKKIKEEKPDFVFSIIPPNTLCYYLWKGKKKYNYRLVFDIIDSWPESFAVNNKFLKIALTPLFTIWRLIRDCSIIHADSILGVSRKALSVFPSCNCEKKLFYPMPREKGELSSVPLDVSEKISFCYLGGINRLVNIDRIVSILSKLRQYKNVEVHLIGDGEKKSYFVGKLSAKGIDVIDHGEMYDWDEKMKVYSQCAFGLNVPNENACVTMSLKGSEYLCAGLPLLNEAFGDTRRLVKQYHAGLNSKGVDADRVAKKIGSFTNDDIKKLKENANRLYVEEFESKNNRNLLF